MDAKQLIDSGDLFSPDGVPEPQIVGKFELVEAGLARPEKQSKHKIATMSPAISVPGMGRVDQSSLQSAMDHPQIGGKITICVLLYGEFHDLHKRCLKSICETVPASRMDLRVACNQVCLQTMEWLKLLPVTKLYVDSGQRKKYPAMRAMFHDKDLPITTSHVVWFDDDSYTLNPQWLEILAKIIVAQEPTAKIGMYGSKMYHPLQAKTGKDYRKWFSASRWWQGRSLQDRRGKDSPNGHCLHFCAGGFWCAPMSAIRQCDIPDPRLNHNGGDVLIGEQLHQNRFALVSFNSKKEYIKTSGAPRRGFSETFPWYR